MISFTVRLRFRDNDVPKVREILEALTVTSRQEPGCVLYVSHFVEGEPATVVIYEQYRDEAAAGAHRATDHFERFAVGGLYQLMLDRQVENLSAVC
jgi:quinol monooxygenase YgiN